MRAMRFAAGVQSNAGLGAGAPIRPSAMQLTPDEEVYVVSIVDYMTNYLRKKTHLRGVIGHLVLLVTVTLICILRASVETVRLSNTQLIANQLNQSGFASITTGDEVYDFCLGLAATAYQSRDRATAFGGQASVAVGAFVVRQWRSANRAAATVVPPQLAANIVPLGGRFNASLPYGTLANFWYANAFSENLQSNTLTSLVNSSVTWSPTTAHASRDVVAKVRFDVSGRIYPASDVQYQLGPFALSTHSLADVMAAIDAARQGGVWISYATKVIVVETMWFNPVSGYFFHGSNALEVLGSGDIITTTASYPFQPLVLRTSTHPTFGLAVGCFILDLALLVCVALVAQNLFRRFALERRLGDALGNPFRFWNIFDVALAIMIVTIVVYHFVHFGLSSFNVAALDASYTKQQQVIASMSNLIELAIDSTVIDRLHGWLFIGTWLRTFAYLQYIPRLSIITEVARGAANDLFGLVLIFIAFIGASSVAAAAIFGNDAEGYHSASSAFDNLAQLAGSGQVNGLSGFRNINGGADVFFICYCFAVIAVLLNACIGYLANGFVNATESFNLVRVNDWSPSAVLRGLRGLLRRYSDDEKQRDVAMLRLTHALVLSSDSARAYDAGEKEAKATFSGVVLTDDSWANEGDTTAGPTTISLRQLRRVSAPLMPVALAETIFRRSQEQRGTHNGTARSRLVARRQRQQDRRIYTNVATQTSLLAQVQFHLFGGAAKDTTNENADDAEGGDVAVLDGGDLKTAAASNAERPGAGAVNADRPMQSFRNSLQHLAATEDRAAERADADAKSLAKHVESVHSISRESAEALEKFQKNRRRRADELHQVGLNAAAQEQQP